jgi:hypothetical protein
MRFLGYLLLLGGLMSMPFFHFARLHDAKGRTLAHSLNPLSESKAYNVDEVRTVLRGALDEMGEALPQISSSAVVMLAGGILLDIASRRKRKATDAA